MSGFGLRVIDGEGSGPGDVPAYCLRCRQTYDTALQEQERLRRDREMQKEYVEEQRAEIARLRRLLPAVTLLSLLAGAVLLMSLHAFLNR